MNLLEAFLARPKALASLGGGLSFTPNTWLFKMFTTADFGQDTMHLNLFVKPLEQTLKALVLVGYYISHIASPFQRILDTVTF